MFRLIRAAAKKIAAELVRDVMMKGSASSEHEQVRLQKRAPVGQVLRDTRAVALRDSLLELRQPPLRQDAAVWKTITLKKQKVLVPCGGCHVFCTPGLAKQELIVDNLLGDIKLLVSSYTVLGDSST